jgi:hypothetical protein
LKCQFAWIWVSKDWHHLRIDRFALSGRRIDPNQPREVHAIRQCGVSRVEVRLEAISRDLEALTCRGMAQAFLEDVRRGPIASVKGEAQNEFRSPLEGTASIKLCSTVGARSMPRLLLAALLLPLLLFGENFRLYLTDGTWHQVSEYKVEQDRVRYYSVERSEWEELPLTLVDLKKTESERGAAVAEAKKNAAADDAEEKFEREQAHIISLVPMNPGTYFLNGEKLETLKRAESKIVNNKRRSVLKVITPVPMVPGKATIEVDGETAAFVVRDDRPTFWFRLPGYERFGIVRCQAKKDSRVVERWNIMPVTKEVAAERDEIEIFRQQVSNDLYKIWPQKPLSPGEYAVIQFTEGGHDTEIWDFRVELPAKQ